MAQAVEELRIGGLPVRKAGQRQKWLKSLIWGDPGAGKTRLAASAYEVESMRPVLYVDIEGGAETFERLWPDIDIIRVEDKLGKDGKVKEWGWEVWKGVNEDLRTGKYNYGTVIVDNLSEAYELCRSWWLYQVVVVQDKGETPGRDLDTSSERDWIKQAALMRKEFRLYRDLPAHVIFTAHKGEHIDRATNVLKRYVPGLPGKLAYQVTGFVGQSLYLDVVPPSKKEQDEGGDKSKGKRRLLSQPVNKYLCKDRSDRLPVMLENPTMKTIADLVLAKEE